MDHEAESIVVSDISVSFARYGTKPFCALDEVSFIVDQRDLVCIVGTNGSGKTTLLKVLAGVLKPDQGDVWFGRQGLYDLPRHERCRRISQVTQLPELGCATRLTVEENLTLALLKGNIPTLLPAMRQRTRDQIIEQLRVFHLADFLEPKFKMIAAELSGGERQALVLAMAVIQKPELLLLDEHTASLDAENRRKMNAMTLELVKEHHITTIMVSHDLNEALQLATKILVLDSGRLVKRIRGPELATIKVDDLRSLFHFQM